MTGFLDTSSLKQPLEKTLSIFEVIDTFLQQGTINNLIGLSVNCEKHSKATFSKRMNEFVSMDVNRTVNKTGGK